VARIGLGHSEFVDWIGLDLSKWTHVQLWVRVRDISWVTYIGISVSPCSLTRGAGF